MTLHVQASARDYWPSSPYTDEQAPSSPAKSMDMETECTPGSRANLSISVTECPSPSPLAWAALAPGHAPEPEPEPTPETVTDTHPDFSTLDLNDWYQRYLSCMRFFLAESQHTPTVQALASFLNIRLPGESADAASVPARTYIRRLIATGQDTPANLRLFFGEDWVAGVGAIRQQERLNYLFAAKSGGWASTKSAYDILPDQQVPFLRPLREPEEEELRVADARWSEWLAMEDWMVGPRRPW
ncbi:hypothetical protein CNMCM6936_006608 [Aspergillus lentulus]|uniref:Uncharacterized protein n=1 Tax=Aspergillus lentulus TaxID=293939 RepID=A0AAN5YNG1_ASPLE|nr:hypothetical protein CNMCM6069_004308 [Aspergillus lentulus]KAF4166408.1 hypothetical protein CNMCM6936_006608 [Aspergillus lentulus]KAF4172827.1 hypothetical protein CNMCM8060_000979 [Aspergillus lentulus]KAF4179246.1 hypothetical protein CNMCM7927_002051 [Aspergillus lentulus]KAF4191686.1 hypothetical protein CNMCM8694_001462 [Aspergillus lentulus]